ncbi:MULTISPECIES: hypothetical protein [Methylobacterium]|uniref:Uncharacterized protein n=2 Tax=Methylobacterium TaxID=407 RepID=A0A2R4WRR1_9HYPH|nr:MULTISPECIES: hypothetical protein [Methylobacterium]AWB24229.1 hypothetical protein DA075_27890 [Methylobacterium currus]NGM35095.1 hypothetical protein [Methylobacterium sp. DB0501]
MLKFLASVARFALAAITLVPRLVWEGGRWIMREVVAGGAGGGAAAAQAQAAAEISAAAQEVAAAKAAPAKAKDSSPVGTPDWEWGTAALHVLAGDRDAGKGILDQAAISYLEKLTPDEGLRLAAFPPDRIGRHLTGYNPIRSLPQAGSPHAYWGAEIKRLVAETERAAVPLLRVDENAGLEEARKAAFAR